MDKKLRDEMLYQLTINIADRFLKLGVIDENQYRQFQEKMLHKYSPYISGITCYLEPLE